LVFVYVNENSIMVDDVVMPSNPLVMLVEEKKLEKTLINVNVSL
jgi:hypothetical protein